MSDVKIMSIEIFVSRFAKENLITATDFNDLVVIFSNLCVCGEYNHKVHGFIENNSVFGSASFDLEDSSVCHDFKNRIYTLRVVFADLLLQVI